MRLFLHQLRGEQRLFWRSRELAFFTFLLPIILFVMLGSAYGDGEIEGTRGSDYLLAGMLGYGVVATTFAGLAISVVVRREMGVLKRLRATPLPAWIYVSALLASTLFVFALEAVLLFVLGAALFDTGLPSRPLSLAFVLGLGAVIFTGLGLALTSLVRSSEGSSAVVNAIWLPMSFISGSFFSPRDFPAFLQAIADVLPLTFLIRLVRDVMLRGESLGSQLDSLLPLLAWGAAGLVVALRNFRWEPRER